MSNNKIKNDILTFYNNQIFQELKAYYGKTTLFNILKIERNENRHSAFLAWLLDENGRNNENSWFEGAHVLKKDGTWDMRFKVNRQ